MSVNQTADCKSIPDRLHFTEHQKPPFFLPLQMLYQEKNPGVEFEYSIPSESIKETPSGGEGYVWSPGPWSECPSECGGSSKTRTIICTLGKEIVADNLCDETVKPPEAESCNEEPCQVRIYAKPFFRHSSLKSLLDN